MLTRSQVFERIDIACLVGGAICVLIGVVTVGLASFNNTILPIQWMHTFSYGTWVFIALLHGFRALNRHTESQSSVDLEKTS